MKQNTINRASGRLLGGLAWTLLAVLAVTGTIVVASSPTVPNAAQDGSRPAYIYSQERFTIAGNAVTQIPTTDQTNRGSVGVRNEDATYTVYVKIVADGATAPTTTTVDDTIYRLGPGESRVYDFDSRFDFYVMNSSAGATTSDIYVQQFQGGAATANNSSSSTVSGSFTGDTELPAVETPGDNLTNATQAPRVNGLQYLYDGSTWDRQPGTSADGALVNLGANNDVSVNAGTNLIGKVSSAPDTTTIYDGTTAAVPKFVVIDHAASGDNTIVAAVASKKIRVLSGLLVASAAVTVRFESGASGTALTGQMQLAANAGFQIPYCAVGNFQTATNTLLNLELSGATSVDGWIVYVEVD